MGLVLLMASLGSLVVIKKQCLSCGKFFTPELYKDIYCSMKCFFDFDTEAKAINIQYSWVLVKEKANWLKWIPEQPLVSKRDWSD